MGTCCSKREKKKARSHRSPARRKETATSILRREAKIVQLAREEDLHWEVPAILMKLPPHCRNEAASSYHLVARAIEQEIEAPIITVTRGDFNKPRVKSGLKEVKVWDEEALAIYGECNSVTLRDLFRRYCILYVCNLP